MPAERLVWLGFLALWPGAVLAAYFIGVAGRRLRFFATTCAIALTLASSFPLAAELLRPTPSPGRFPALSLVLLPFAALLWLLTVIVTPSSRRTEAGFARTAASCLLDLAAFSTVAPAALIAVWIASSLILAASHSESRFAEARRIIVAHLGLSTVCLAAGALLAPSQWGVGLILIAVLIRKGIFPFHAWIPETFDKGRIGPVARFNAPQLGTYVALVLALPQAGAAMLKTCAVLALVTAVYGSLLALYQRDARRACGYLFVSQSALVVAGLTIPSRGAFVGALILWLGAGVALAGLCRAVLALEARRGRLRLDVRHGGYERMPQLAACFLIMSLAIADFPGTLGFVGGEMLVRGAVDSFPILGLLTVLAVAMNGLAAMRMYFSLFCGKRDSGVHLPLGRSEALGFAAAALILLGFGLAPRGLVRVLDRGVAAAPAARVALSKK
ncbi:MAG TPA: proton-conducting transporter membrane subunit [Elusimicrobiota bacterium]|jgi:NADH-quinone oxidoreductase subunit M|nr:proton-conducting transporter membrane subunit [Elusimicrobiota bacterium]